MSPRPTTPPASIEDAERRVLAVLADVEPGGIVALSGGTDSALVLHLLARAWGPERVVAATSASPSLPSEELQLARERARAEGVELVVFEGAELEDEAFRQNASDRCFHCKTHLYTRLTELAEERGLPHVVDGANADDTGDHRPGLQAARQHGVLSPLLLGGLSKAWVRALSKHYALPTWDKPAEACLSSRFPYGTEVTAVGLERVERAERALKALGFPIVRVRVHDPVARVEVPVDDLARLLAPGIREQAVAALKDAGFAYVAVDAEGFRSGSLNETLGSGERRGAAHERP